MFETKCIALSTLKIKIMTKAGADKGCTGRLVGFICGAKSPIVLWFLAINIYIAHFLPVIICHKKGINY